MPWRALFITGFIITTSTLSADSERPGFGNGTSVQNVCASDTARWAPRARSFIVSTLSDTDYSADQLPYRPAPSLVHVVTDQATCDAAHAARTTTFGVPYSQDSILVVRIGTAAYVVFEALDSPQATSAGSFWTSTWEYRFMLVGI